MAINLSEHLMQMPEKQKKRDDRGNFVLENDRFVYETVMKYYLPVAPRIIAFWEEHPDWSIETEVIELNMNTSGETAQGPNGLYPIGHAVMRCVIRDDKGRVRATGTKVEHQADFPDFVEKAETGAVGRALGSKGIGTLYAKEMLSDDMHDPVDAPSKAKPALGASATSKTDDTPTQPPSARGPRGGKPAGADAKPPAEAKASGGEAAPTSETKASADNKPAADSPAEKNKAETMKRIGLMLNDMKAGVAQEWNEYGAKKYGAGSTDMNTWTGSDVILFNNAIVKAMKLRQSSGIDGHPYEVPDIGDDFYAVTGQKKPEPAGQGDKPGDEKPPVYVDHDKAETGTVEQKRTYIRAAWRAMSEATRNGFEEHAKARFGTLDCEKWSAEDCAKVIAGINQKVTEGLIKPFQVAVVTNGAPF